VEVITITCVFNTLGCRAKIQRTGQLVALIKIVNTSTGWTTSVTRITSKSVSMKYTSTASEVCFNFLVCLALVKFSCLNHVLLSIVTNSSMHKWFIWHMPAQCWNSMKMDRKTISASPSSLHCSLCHTLFLEMLVLFSFLAFWHQFSIVPEVL